MLNNLQLTDHYQFFFLFFSPLLYYFIHDSQSFFQLLCPVMHTLLFYLSYFEEAKALAGVFPVSHQEFSHLQCHQRPSLVTTHALAKVGSPYRLPTHPPTCRERL